MLNLKVSKKHFSTFCYTVENRVNKSCWVRRKTKKENTVKSHKCADISRHLYILGRLAYSTQFKQLHRTTMNCTKPIYS